MAKIRVTQVRNGKRVTFLTPDKGKPGKTPKAKRWFKPRVRTGWEKDMAQDTRLRRTLAAHDGDKLAAGQAMQALANVTTDRETRQKAQADARYFFRDHKRQQPCIGGRSIRITPKTPRLRR